MRGSFDVEVNGLLVFVHFAYSGKECVAVF
jgi:hypothetical protein